MKVTFTEIAKLAGVSVPTVSRYFNQQTVSPQNQLKIAQAAKALHYKPNKAGSKTVLVLLPTVTNPLYAEFYEAVQGNLAQLGYDCQPAGNAPVLDQTAAYCPAYFPGNTPGQL
ncbi:hypothetical protein FD23_GL001552 [Lactobacillus delbrueckii subsp. delbrueckii DSM 20074 = JCM 1012]|uniref:LacI family DNA-binding transcriptional regulator n=1 Tax=Lactobacillus delbrueckii TaxID=1584 RepID=UPI0004716222|nr:LacI family DNA-binding transcriptional regulator [Lactobacillus delbrueckii]KRK18708.1 hypothetical protein FD23_GL001552 [Lactobacillus delbrueckii subsp. delbrueckii DSM 20074 = JCM 1012]